MLERGGGLPAWLADRRPCSAAEIEDEQALKLLSPHPKRRRAIFLWIPLSSARGTEKKRVQDLRIALAEKRCVARYSMFIYRPLRRGVFVKKGFGVVC